MLDGIELLLESPCLAGIDLAELENIPLRRTDFSAGEWVLTPHTPVADLFFVAEGVVEILDASRRRHLVRVTTADPGDSFGEHRLERTPPAWAVRAQTDCVLFRWPQDDLVAFLEDHPETRRALRFLGASRRLASALRFDWLAEGETIHGLARKHPALLLVSLLLPALLASGGVGLLAAGGLGGSPIAITIGAVVSALGILWAGWNALDWRNDYYIVTDRRVVWLEKVIGLYDNRQESPLKMILSVQVESGLTGRQLGFGDVEVRTYTGAITFAGAPYPDALAATVEALGRRLQRSHQLADRETIREAVRERLHTGSPEPARGLSRPSPDADRTQAAVGLDRWSLESRFVEDGVVTYRKHLAVLIQRLLVPSALFLAVVGLAGAALAGIPAPSSAVWFYPVLAASALAAAGWGLYEFADWANDVYQISPTHILAVHKKPLGRERRKVAPLENILGTEVDRRGLIGILLNYGDVVANVGTASFLFEHILNPSAAQQDIVRAQEALVERKLEADRKRRQVEMVEWLAAYHQQTAPPDPPDPSA